jgi:two-component system sensor histidine kinase MprB
MSLKARLVLVAATAVAVVVVLASGIVYFLVRGELRGQVDERLRTQGARAAQVFNPAYSAATTAPGVFTIFSGLGSFNGPGYYQAVDVAGDVYQPTDAIDLPVTNRVRAVADGTGAAFYSDATVSDEHIRILNQPAATSGYAVQVVASLADVDHELARIKLWLALVALGGVALAGGAGFLVARATLRPVVELSEAAERVRTTRDLSERIEVDGSDELSRLAETFNAMLASLDDAAQRQRQLVQDASHELRTPLTSLRTNIEVLARADELPPDDREQLLHDVIAQLGEMTDLISELTELARGEELAANLEEVRLDLVAEEAIRRTARNHPEVTVAAELDPTVVTGTPAALERAIANLLDNAAKWSPRGGTIDVRLTGSELTVRDHGPGIAADDRPHVFERFYRATSARSMPGSGLGLAIVQQVAHAHGGFVEVEEAPGGGTLMRFRVAAESARAPEASPSAG